ncbi:MAG: hypothetical protein RL026_2438 [Pseudomonadota bacterium]|jgi:ElaB/YqjD/DUF883 family membrane-anchored ribosome-binding protein
MNTEPNVDRLMTDVRQVMADVEELLKATAGQAGDRIEEARARAERTLGAAKARLGSMEDQVTAQAREAAGQADDFVRGNPWQAIGIAAGVAFLVGLLVSRR